MRTVNSHACNGFAHIRMNNAPIDRLAREPGHELVRCTDRAHETFYERGTAPLAEIAADNAPSLLRRVGIIGASTTGVSIAMNLLDADIPVTIFDIERTSLDKGIALARSAYQRDRRMSLLAGTVNLHHLKDCDLIIA